MWRGVRWWAEWKKGIRWVGRDLRDLPAFVYQSIITAEMAHDEFMSEKIKEQRKPK